MSDIIGNFLEAILSHIVDGKNSPKVQVERQISPFIDLYIEEIISASNKIVGEFTLIATEFPLETKTEKQNQLATNIDYLLLDEKNNHLLFVELKTDSKSFKREQFEIYKEIVDRINATKSAEFLRLFLDDLKNPKYKAFVKQIDTLLPSESWSNITKSSIIYIAPKKTKENPNWGDKNRKTVDRIQFIHFEDLPQKTSLYPKEWAIIRKKLIELDNN